MFKIELFNQIAENIFVLKKSNWHYEGVEEFQLSCVEYVKENPRAVLLIFCHHDYCFTLGRGLQKLPSESLFKLIDFDHSTKLNFPLFNLKRGGGLTFHYPGQIVFYPILNLTYHKLSVHDLMLLILEMSKDILNEFFSMNNLTVDKTLLGLWSEQSSGRFKVASIGLAVTRFNTYHGLALNVLKDEKMFEHLLSLNPCGIAGEHYRPVEELIGKKLNSSDVTKLVNAFEKKFLELIQSQAMMDRQISSAEISLEIST